MVKSKESSHFGGGDKFGTHGLKNEGYALWFYAFTLLTISINMFQMLQHVEKNQDIGGIIC